MLAVIADSSSDLKLLRLALAEAGRCEPTPTAFCVGCVLAYRDETTNEPTVLTTGYSRELPGNTHAEANALTKLRGLSSMELASRLPSLDPSKASVDDILHRVDVYTTLEPCSVRTSGLAPCADALIAARVRRCFIGVGEPDDFVQCEGARKLKAAGVEVVWLKGMEDECLAAARRGHDEK
ncbi:cytidine deaminase-like protein [Schizophyllum fasciatum]